MGEPPRGTVTFLFTDIEGSTRLLTRLRGRYVEVLAEHRRLLRAVFEKHGGHAVDTAGDAFFVAFARASDAIAAAVSAQRALASRCWPEGVEVRVRMGLHTGEATLRLGRYVGLDVHRGARICAAGHGGQVLLSRATRELIADELPSDVALRDLGEHRLKDLGGLLASAGYGAICEGCDRDATAFLERAEGIARTLEDAYLLMLIRGNTGLVALFMGDIDTAQTAFCEELKLCREMVILPVAHEGLRGLAAAAIVEGDIPHAARLIGAATAHRYGDPQDPVDARLRSTFFDDARRHSGAAWDAAIAEGATLSFNHAIAYALGRPRSQFVRSAEVER